MNEYAALIGLDLYERTPKAVLAAIAVSYTINSEGDAREYVLSEWATLHHAGIVPQAPPKVKP